MTPEQKETLELIQQLAKQQDTNKLLEMKLSKCQLEKENVEIENTVFAIEQSVSQMSSVNTRCAKLMKENARLQIESGIMRRSFMELCQDAGRKSMSDD